MPPNEVHDYTLKAPGGRVLGFMLARERGGGRAWKRSGVQDAPSRRNINDTLYGNIPDTLDHPEVWNDWSGGFGDAYETPERLNSYHWARGFDLRFPRQAIHAQAPQLLAAAYASARQNINYVMDVGRFASGSTADQVVAFGRGVVSFYTPTQYQNTAGSAFTVTNLVPTANLAYGNRGAVFGSFLYVPNLSGSHFHRIDPNLVVTTAGWNATQTSTVANNAIWFEVNAGRLWSATIGGRSLHSAPDNISPVDVTAGWSASIGIEGASADALSLNDQLMVGIPQGLLAGNTTGTFNNIADDLSRLSDTDNCRDLAAYQGGVAFAQGPHVWWYRPSTGGNSELREIGPSSLFSNRSALRGKFTCVRGNGKWLYAGLFTGSGSYFLVGRDASPPLPYVWHPLHDFLGLNCKVHRIHVDSVVKAFGGTVNIPNRIWAATEPSYGTQVGATAPLFVWPIPLGDNNPLGDVTFSPNYMGSARLDMPQSEWMAPGTSKVWRATETWAENLAAGAQYGDLYYHIDQGARATLGRVTLIPKDTRYFSSGEGSFNTGQALGLSIDSFTASLNITPVYRAFVTRGALMPNSADTIEAMTHVGLAVRDRRGGKMRSGAAMLQELRTLSRGSAPALLTDLAGNQSWVAVQAPIEEDEFYQAGSDDPELMAVVKMAVLEFSSG